MKRVIIVSDLHCGHNYGLTPPEYYNHQKDIQKIGWEWAKKEMKALGKIDVCICLGDAVDGPGHKDSTEHNTTDTSKQSDIAIRCIESFGAKKHIFFRGTPFHTKTSYEAEDPIAHYFSAPIMDSGKIDINGLLFHGKHTTSKGGSPYASVTSLQRTAIVTHLNDITKETEHADVYGRAHIHEWNLVQRELFTAFTNPCFQFSGTAYGRRCEGFYSYGFCVMDVYDKHKFTINPHILKLHTGKKSKVLKV